MPIDKNGVYTPPTTGPAPAVPQVATQQAAQTTTPAPKPTVTLQPEQPASPPVVQQAALGGGGGNSSDTQHQSPADRDFREIATSFGYGFGISITFGFVISMLSGVLVSLLFGSDAMWNPNSPLLVTFGVGTVFFMAGIRKVAVASFAVLTFFGKRCRAPIAWLGMSEAYLTEGYWWIIPIPFITNIEISFSSEEFVIEVKDRRVIVRSANDGNARTTGGVEAGLIAILASATVTAQVKDPIGYIDREQSIASASSDVVEQVLRAAFSGMTVWDILTNQKALSGLNEEIRLAIQTASDANYWGLKINQVALPKVTPENQSLVTAYEQVTVEELQTASETIEIDHMIDRVKQIKEGTGMNATESHRAFLVAQGKLKPEEIGIRNGGKGGGRGPVIITDGN